MSKFVSRAKYDPLTIEVFINEESVLSEGKIVYINKSGGYLSTYASYTVGCPTNNCQWGSICNTDKILKALPDDNDVKIVLGFIVRYLISKNLFLIDIAGIYKDRIEAIFGESKILSKTPYTNTTGSNMILYLFRTDGLLENLEKLDI